MGGKPVGYLQSVVNLPLLSPETNPFSCPSRGLEPVFIRIQIPESEPRIKIKFHFFYFLHVTIEFELKKTLRKYQKSFVCQWFLLLSYQS